MYRLDRAQDDAIRRLTIEETLDAIQRAHVRALSREIDSLIYRRNRDVIVTASAFVSEIRDALSSAPLVSFQIVGEPIFEGDLDDTDSLDVSALRRKLNGRSKR